MKLFKQLTQISSPRKHIQFDLDEATQVWIILMLYIQYSI